MSPHEKRNYHPADRLYVSSQGYTEKHVKNIAARLAERHSATIPSRSYWVQDDYANWITTNFQRDEIADVERSVRQSYSYGEKIYRKGRPIGSKNRRHYEPSSSSADNSSWEADLGLSEAEATSIAAHGLTAAVEPPSHVHMASGADMSRYALKTDVADVADQLNRSIREHNSSVGTAFNKLEHNVANSLTLLADKINNIELSKPTIVTLERKELPAIELGVQHRHFPELLAMCNASLRSGSRINVWVYGPAGTGKTTAAHNVANALGLKFYAMSALETGFQVLGYNDANGNYVSTLFRQCWEHGGVIILDEIDSYQPSAALALNGALANGHCAFPDKIVPRHNDCIIIAGANTTGLGGTMEYSGRMKQDAAFLDRWCPLDWPLDDALEDALCANKEWLAIVRKVRANVIRVQMKGCMVTPRASIYGEALLAAGISLDRVIKSVLYKGMSQAQIDQVKP